MSCFSEALWLWAGADGWHDRLTHAELLAGRWQYDCVRGRSYKKYLNICSCPPSINQPAPSLSSPVCFYPPGLFDSLNLPSQHAQSKDFSTSLYNFRCTFFYIILMMMMMNMCYNSLIRNGFKTVMYCKRDRLEMQLQRKSDDWKLNIGKKINNHNLLWERERGKYQWIKVSLLFFQEMTLFRFCYFRKRELLAGLQMEARDHRNSFFFCSEGR